MLCSFCDTKFTWDLDPEQQTEPRDVVRKPASGTAAWAAMTTGAILAAIQRFPAPHVVITGGEPAMHDLSQLTDMIAHQGRRAQIETSGTYPVRVHVATWVTLSPKIDMPGGLSVRDEAIARADEIKMPVGRQADLDALSALLDRKAHQPDAAIWLQPLSRSPKATALCVRAVTANNWRLSVQTHAYVGLR